MPCGPRRACGRYFDEKRLDESSGLANLPRVRSVAVDYHAPARLVTKPKVFGEIFKEQGHVPAL
jgi:hypothetical protein